MRPSQLKFINGVVNDIKQMVADNDPALAKYLVWVENTLNENAKAVVRHFIRTDIANFKGKVQF